MSGSRTQGRRLVWGALGACLAGPARADEVGDALRKLGDIDQRVRLMAQEFKEAPPPSADLADRRVLDAQVLYGLKNYEEAATLLLDVLEKWPNTRAATDAIFLLGESLFQLRDYYSSRRYYEMAVASFTGTKREQEALERLVEIALRTGDFEHVDDYLAKLDRVPPQVLEPSVPYVKAKYLFFRDRFDEALAIFGGIAPSSPYHFQARYFMATIAVKKEDLAAATVAYDALIKLQPPDDGAKEIQDLARLAMARILYERSVFDKAVDFYQSVSRQSRLFADALFEVGWTYVKGKDFQKAYRAFDLLLLTNPDSLQAPELKLLMGNLHLRMGNFFLAHDAFTKTGEEFEPIHRQMQDVVGKTAADPNFFTNLVGQNLDKFDIGVFIPPAAAKWVRADPEVSRMLGLAGDVVEIQRALKDAGHTVSRLERAIASTSKVGLFPDLARARSGSIEVLDQLVTLRGKFVAKVRKLEESSLTPSETRDLDRIAAERDSLERQLKVLPLSENARNERGKERSGAFTSLDGLASELNVEIQGMEAQLVAIEQYYRQTRLEQRIAAEDVSNPVREMRAALDELRAQHEKIRDEIADASREAAVAGAAGEIEMAAAKRLEALLKQEADIQTVVKPRLTLRAQESVNKNLEVLSRADGVEASLLAFDKRIDDQADRRLDKIKGYIAAEKDNLAAAGQKVGVVMGESQTLGGGLAQAMFGRVAGRFYDLVVRSDVGLIDVVWGLKDQKTTALNRLVTQQKLELKTLDEDFARLLEETK